MIFVGIEGEYLGRVNHDREKEKYTWIEGGPR